MKKYLFVGGDKRQSYAAAYITRAGNIAQAAFTYPQLRALIGGADYIVLPLPVSRDGIHISSMPEKGLITLEELLFELKKGMVVFAGMPDEYVAKIIKCKGAELYDYYKIETLSLFNSISTAEGIIFELIGGSEINLHGSKTLVTGYGKAASAVAVRLLSLGSEVTVAARSERDRTAALCAGCKAIPLYEISDIAEGFDFVVNTVPARVIDEKIISKLKKSCVMVEIASVPFGIDFECAEKHGIKVIKAPSLPGRISPVSAGEAIAKTIQSIAESKVIENE